MNKRSRVIYFTHCTKKKDVSSKKTKKKVTPDKLYRGVRIQGFIKECMEKNVDWAIFSDKYGIWFPKVRHKWYNTSPGDVPPKEFEKLVSESYKRLKAYDKIFFYANPRSARFAHLYKEMKNGLHDKGLNIHYITHKADIR